MHLKIFVRTYSQIIIVFRRVEIRNQTTLIFHEIEVEDAGQYECFARNYVGQATATAEVVVSGKYLHIRKILKIIEM